MSDGTAGIGRTIRAGLSGWAPGVRDAWAALVVGSLASLTPSLLSPGLSFLSLPIELAATTLAYGALYRLAFGGPKGVKGLRWGVAEWRLLATELLVTAVLTVLAAVLSVVVGAVAMGVARSAPAEFDTLSLEAFRGAMSGWGGMTASLVAIAAMLLMVWMFVRLALAPAATVALGRIQVLSAFPRTRGAVLLLVAVGVVLSAPACILVMVIGYLSAVAGLPDVAPVSRLIGVVLVFFYLIPVWTAALVHVYRHHVPPTPAPGSVRS
ncbi:MAG: hypothetical protein J7521_16300 [Caulobacter sp.]|nr:hypothetical protein [Caulobacter sp.]